MEANQVHPLLGAKIHTLSISGNVNSDEPKVKLEDCKDDPLGISSDRNLLTDCSDDPKIKSEDDLLSETKTENYELDIDPFAELKKTIEPEMNVQIKSIKNKSRKPSLNPDSLRYDFPEDTVKANQVHPLLGAKIPTLSRSSLPSKLQIINFIRFKMDSKRMLKKEKFVLYREVAKDLISIWREAYIICFDEDYVIKIIQTKIIPLLLDVQKNNKHYHSKEELKTAKLAELKEIFDIAKCPCFRDKKGSHKPRAEFIYTNCVCPEKDKIVNFPTYYDQVFDQSFDRSLVILISEDDKKNFETIFAHPDFQPVIRGKNPRKTHSKEPLVLENPEILPPKRKKPCLKYGVINDEGFNEDECLVQTDNPTNDIQNQTDEKPRTPSCIVEEMKVVENKSLSLIPNEENIDSSTDVAIIGSNLEEDPLNSDVMSVYEEKKEQLLCSICNKSYSDMPKHMKQFHTEIFKCNICEYETPRKHFLKKHIESDHEVFKPLNTIAGLGYFCSKIICM